jgi:hypothetical protein
MTSDQFAAIAQLLAYFKIDEGLRPLWRRKLSCVGLELLNRAMDCACEQYPPGRLSFAEFKPILDGCRQELLAPNPFRPCRGCERNPGWISNADAAGIERLERCECYRRWQNCVEEMIGTYLPAGPPDTHKVSTPKPSIAAMASDLVDAATTVDEARTKLVRFRDRLGKQSA